MEVCLFLFGYRNGMHREPRDIDISLIQAASQNAEGLRRFVIHRSVESADDDPLSKELALKPRWVLQWYFDDLDPVEAVLQRGGAAHTIVEQAIDAAQDRPAFAQQLMAVRKFATPNVLDTGNPSEKCTYLVGYEGEAHNFNAWLTHYLKHHPPLMAQLPGIRELEIYTRVDYRTGLDIPQATAMQRNKVVFDDPAALAAALASPIRAQMKQDFDAFPPYSGPAAHFPMHSIYGNLKRT
ncbi:EthD family reductase [Paraburkholderia sediminicola]|uniref:EthD family reductase n=1 Tax=Paraburkholderia sediminicola TaxID=458836 RepID=UPI0038BA7B86